MSAAFDGILSEQKRQSSRPFSIRHLHLKLTGTLIFKNEHLWCRLLNCKMEYKTGTLFYDSKVLSLMQASGALFFSSVNKKLSMPGDKETSLLFKGADGRSIGGILLLSSSVQINIF